MLEKEAEEWRKSLNYEIDNDSFYNIAIPCMEFGYNKAMKEWRDCFMSCSSPYCADKFRDIQCDGMLGNMTKEVRDGSVE